MLGNSYVEDPSSTSSSNMADDPILPGTAPPPTNALVAIVEDSLGGAGLDEKVNIGIVSIVPSTGEVVWDEFQGMMMVRCSLLTY
jgi:DNA mismatch repair protein MSH3